MTNFAPKDGKKKRRKVYSRKKPGSIHRKILVTGSGRSGTTTMTSYLRDLDYNVDHENMGPDGTVSCYFFTDHTWYPKGAQVDSHVDDGHLSLYTFDTIIHLVRDPLKQIRSQATLYSKNHKIWLDEIGLVPLELRPNLLHAAKHWLELNRTVEKLTRKRIRIEELYTDEGWRKMSRWLGNAGDQPKRRHMNKATGYHKREPITWKDLETLDAGLTEQIKKLAGKYGYTY